MSIDQLCTLFAHDFTNYSTYVRLLANACNNIPLKWSNIFFLKLLFCHINLTPCCYSFPTRALDSFCILHATISILLDVTALSFLDSLCIFCASPILLDITLLFVTSTVMVTTDTFVPTYSWGFFQSRMETQHI